MTTLINNVSFTPVSNSTGCGYCGSSNCGALFGDPICNELPIPAVKTYPTEGDSDYCWTCDITGGYCGCCSGDYWKR